MRRALALLYNRPSRNTLEPINLETGSTRPAPLIRGLTSKSEDCLLSGPRHES